MRWRDIIFGVAKALTLLSVTLLLTARPASGLIEIAGARTNAFDNMESGVYDDGWDLTDNGGFGYESWSQIITPDLPVLNTATFPIEGTRSFQLPSEPSGTNIVGRPLALPLTNGYFSVLVRNLTGLSGFSGFGLFTNTTPTSFLSQSLVSFGMAAGNDNAVRVIVGSSTNTLNLGENLVGDTMHYVLQWDGAAGKYVFMVTNLNGSGFAKFSGSLAALGPVRMVGVANFNNLEDHRLRFDNMAILTVVPEPSVALLLGVGFATIYGARRRRKRLDRQA